MKLAHIHKVKLEGAHSCAFVMLEIFSFVANPTVISVLVPFAPVAASNNQDLRETMVEITTHIMRLK